VLVSLSHWRGHCIYRCIYGSKNGVRATKSREQKISKWSCNHRLSSATLVIPPPERSSGSKFGWFGGEVGGEIYGVSSLKLLVRRSTAMSGQKYLYTVPQTAELLGLSKTTVYELIRSGELLAVHPTTSARISNSSITAFVRTLEEKEIRAAKALRKQFV
jgi:excisionase family DNA binding protein